MLCRQFLSWAQGALAGDRADAARALAHAYLYAEIDRIEQGEMERAMTCLLDDPSPVVRRALAEALAGAVDAPHHLVSALSNDQADVAAPVLGRSPLLSDAELIDAVALGAEPAQRAIAGRAALSVSVAGAIAEVGARGAVLALCANHAAALAEVSARRILERFPDDGEMREALGARPDVPPTLRHDLVVATAEALRRFVVDCGWTSPERARRVAAEGAERAGLALAREAGLRGGAGGGRDFAAHLRRRGQLTPALMLRSLLSRDGALFDGALAELSGQDPDRVAAVLSRRDGLGFAALYRAARLPEALLPAFSAAVEARRAAAGPPKPEPGLQRRLVSRALEAVGPARDGSMAGLTALLRRFEAEAAREETRAIVAAEEGAGVLPDADRPPAAALLRPAA